MNLIQYMYNKDDYSNAEPEELVAGFRRIIYRIKRPWSKQKKEFEEMRKKNNSGEQIGKALQLIRLIYKNVDTVISRGELNERKIKLLSQKGKEAKEIIKGVNGEKSLNADLADQVKQSLDEVSKLEKIAQGLLNINSLGIDCFGILPKSFKMTIRDNRLQVNNYLIARPNATGVNCSFITYIVEDIKKGQVEYKQLPTWLTNELGKRKDRRFIKILNELNIKGEMQKVFFPQVKDDSLKFRGLTILKSTLENEGINIKALVQELEEIDLNNKEK